MIKVGVAFSVLLASGCLLTSAQPARAQLFLNVSVRLAPPPLPLYDQPPLPGPDYMWLPGFWAWDDYAGDYFWVPGTWALAPRPGLVWTPSWWEWQNDTYLYHAGYWGRHVGWYGGVAYGFGYTGFGYEGGYWNGPHFTYNRIVNNITDVHITNVYSKTVVVNKTVINNVSYSGGPGGVQARPTPALLAATRGPHFGPTPAQIKHVTTARATPQLFASANRGAPAIAATVVPARLIGPGITRSAALRAGSHSGSNRLSPAQPEKSTSALGSGPSVNAQVRKAARLSNPQLKSDGDVSMPQSDRHQKPLSLDGPAIRARAESRQRLSPPPVARARKLRGNGAIGAQRAVNVEPRPPYAAATPQPRARSKVPARRLPGTPQKDEKKTEK